MTHHPELTGEHFSHKAAAVFASESSAVLAADALRAALNPETSRVSVLTPGQDHIGRVLEPERTGILRTLVRSHLWMGLFGAASGAIIFLVLSGADVPWVTQSPLPAAAAAIVFGAVAGLLFGGLITLRPDHSLYIEATRRAHDEGRTVVIVHAGSGKICAEAAQIIDRFGGQTIRTL